MYFQMMRVISSPSISTTGFATLIFAIEFRAFFAPAKRGEPGGPRGAALMARRRPSCKAISASAGATPPRCAVKPVDPAGLMMLLDAGNPAKEIRPHARIGNRQDQDWIVAPGPIVILVEPQLGDNIGATARAMANFGLSRLRLIKPRDGWPKSARYVAASGADRILERGRRSTIRSRRRSPTALTCWRRPRAPTTRPSP